MVDSTLYVKYEKDYQIIVVVYVDDIIFGGCKDEFEISMIGEVSYFLGLQVN